MYACFLSDEARAAMGGVHPDSAPALAMLLEEGMQDQGYIDIFDGGVTIEAQFNQIRSIRDSQTLLLAIVLVVVVVYAFSSTRGWPSARWRWPAGCSLRSLA